MSQKSLNDEERRGNCLLVPERSYGPACYSFSPPSAPPVSGSVAPPGAASPKHDTRAISNTRRSQKDVSMKSAPAVNWSVGVSQCDDTVASQQLRTSIVLRCSSDGLELVSGHSSGPNAEHRQLPIGIKDSSVRGATGQVAH